MPGSTSTEVRDSSTFWDIEGYKPAVNRLENAYKICNDYCTLLQERGEIEKAYASNLSKWSAKWAQFFDSSFEYGTVKNAWKSLSTEANHMAAVHKDMREGLTQVIPDIKKWQKENFHKPALSGQPKEVKQLDQEFDKSQKPWSKCYRQVMQSRKDYHNACKNWQSAKIQLHNAKADSSTAPEQHQKLEEKCAKAERENSRTKDVYESALKALNDYNPRYMDDMTKVFEGGQERERMRIHFVTETLNKIHSILDISHNTQVNHIYDTLKANIDSITVSNDLSWWARMYGADMQMYCLQFEEYNPDASSLSKQRKGIRNGDNNIVLTGVNSSSRTMVNEPSNFSINEVGSSVGGGTLATKYPTESSPVKPQISNPYVNTDEAPMPEYENLMQDDGRPGQKVRALYDYAGAEDDELSFKTGDLFEKLGDEDEQGWCMGRKNGQVGLYPANYAVAM